MNVNNFLNEIFWKEVCQVSEKNGTLFLFSNPYPFYRQDDKSWRYKKLIEKKYMNKIQKCMYLRNLLNLFEKMCKFNAMLVK